MPPRAELAPPDGPPSVLLIEHDSSDAEHIRDQLGSEVSALRICATLPAAEDALAQDDADVVLYDYALPDGDGLAGVERIVAAADTIPVVVLLPEEDDADARACLEAGADEALSKPLLDRRGLTRALLYARARAQARDLVGRLERAGRYATLGELTAGISDAIANPATHLILDAEQLGDRLQRLYALYIDGELMPESDIVREHTAFLFDDLLELLERSREGVDRIVTTMSGLHQLALVPAGPEPELDLVDAVRCAAAFARPLARGRAAVITELRHCPTIAADRQLVERALLNLLVNAMEAIEPGTPVDHEVRITLRPAMREVCIDIEDTGGGIARHDLERVTRPFFTRNRGRDRAGLGLTQAAYTVQSLGGTLGIESAPGKGTRVSISIPNAEAVPSTRPPVLVVDPGSAFRARVDDVLFPTYDVVSVDQAAAARRLLLEGRSFAAVFVARDLAESALDDLEQAARPDVRSRIVVAGGPLSGGVCRAMHPTVPRSIGADHLLTLVRRLETR